MQMTPPGQTTERGPILSDQQGELNEKGDGVRADARVARWKAGAMRLGLASLRPMGLQTHDRSDYMETEAARVAGARECHCASTE